MAKCGTARGTRSSRRAKGAAPMASTTEGIRGEATEVESQTIAEPFRQEVNVMDVEPYLYGSSYLVPCLVSPRSSRSFDVGY